LALFFYVARTVHKIIGSNASHSRTLGFKSLSKLRRQGARIVESLSLNKTCIDRPWRGDCTPRATLFKAACHDRVRQLGDDRMSITRPDAQCRWSPCYRTLGRRVPDARGEWRRGEQDGGLLQELTRQPSGLGGKPHLLLVVQQDAFVLLLLFLEDSDLLFEIPDGLPDLFIGQEYAEHVDERNPQFLFCNPERLRDGWVADKCFRR